MRALHAPRTAGFTLVELVVVLVILGIIAAFAAPRFFDDRTFLTRGYYEELAAALKYAQKLAVASGCPVRVTIDAAGYVARQQAAQGGSCNPSDTSWPTAVALADGQALAGSAPLGVVVTPAVTMTFDALGETDLDADQAISVGPFTLTVSADSGFVQAP
jgi:MSHA pilin protein MshC